MSREALYRKYRSRDFSEIVGQEHITSVLEAALAHGNISHAYLLTGQRGTGKTSVARILAHRVNDLPYGEESFDIIEIDAASHGLKEDIKELIEKSAIAPTSQPYKVYIIDEIHSMKHDAFNTFLKLLEEPPAHVIFILATTDPQKLPPTILSRAQRYHFRPIEPEQVASRLKQIAGKENIDISDEALQVIAQRGEGSLRDAISLLDQLSSLPGKIDVQTVEDILGLAPTPQIDQLLNSITSGDSQATVQTIRELQRSGVSGRTVLDQLIQRLLAEASDQPALYRLIDQLVDSVSAYDIYLKLLAVLTSFAQTAPPAASPAKPKSAQDTVAPIKPKPAQEAVAPVKPIISEPQTAADFPQTIDWDKLVDSLKQTNATCGNSLARASYDYDGETLTLYFNSRVFRERMKDASWKSALRRTLKELYQTAPKIQIADAAKPPSAAIAAVADIMGGGEVL